MSERNDGAVAGNGSEDGGGVTAEATCVVCAEPGKRRTYRSYGTPIVVVLCATCVSQFTAIPWVAAEGTGP